MQHSGVLLIFHTYIFGQNVFPPKLTELLRLRRIVFLPVSKATPSRLACHSDNTRRLMLLRHSGLAAVTTNYASFAVTGNPPVSSFCASYFLTSSLGSQIHHYEIYTVSQKKTGHAFVNICPRYNDKSATLGGCFFGLSVYKAI